MNKFENIIKDNAQDYYDNGTQKLTDEEFDAIIENIKQNNPNSVTLSTGWGSSISENSLKFPHKYGHIGSLNKAHNWNDVEKYFVSDELKTLDVSAKCDGLSCVIYIEDGFIVKALTRGDGENGLDITDKIYKIFGCQIRDKSFTGAVRGELMMSKENFKEYKECINSNASNQRNVTAGIINRNNIDRDIFYIRFYAYSIVGQEADNKNSIYMLQLSDLKQWLIDNFIYVAPRVSLSLNINNFENELKTLKEEWEEEFFIDGVVLSRNWLSLRNNNYIEQKAIAYKFDDEKVATTVSGIEWTMSKNGVYIPVILIEPIVLDNTIIKRVTGFNAKYIRDNNIKEGTIVMVCKRNQIIPQIVDIIEV